MPGNCANSRFRNHPGNENFGFSFRGLQARVYFGNYNNVLNFSGENFFNNNDQL